MLFGVVLPPIPPLNYFVLANITITMIVILYHYLIAFFQMIQCHYLNNNF